MVNAKVRVGMLGMGNMGRTHIAQLRKMDDVEIAALCAKPLEDAARYNQQNGADFPVYQDFYRMLEEQAMDALYVCLPPFAHDGQIEAAAKKGIHLFAEKPLALSVERGESMAEAVRSAGVRSQMGYHMRFGGAVEMLRSMMERGETGRPTLFSANYQCNSLHTPWWIDKNLCGGQIFEQIIHLYDMALYLMGEADSVTGYVANLCHTDVPGYTVEDTSSVSLRFKSGALGSITGSNCAVPNTWVGAFKIVFENMVVEFPEFNNCTVTYTKGEVRRQSFSFDTDVRWAENRRFIDVVKGKADEIAPIREGLQGIRMVAGAVYSSDHGGVPFKV